jgi:hypothetical protein
MSGSINQSIEEFIRIFQDHLRRYKEDLHYSAPNTIIIRPAEGDTLVTFDRHKHYRMGDGMLLYLIIVKHS